MKKIIFTFLYVFLLCISTTIQAQNYSKHDIDFLKKLRKSLYQKIYLPDSLISKTVDPETTFPWQSQTFKRSAAILDTLGATMQTDKSSGYFFMYGYFPEKTSEQDCRLFTGNILSYNLVNEKNKKIQLLTKNIADLGERRRHNDLIGYVLHLRFMPLSPSNEFKGFVEYEIAAPTGFNSIEIAKSDTGKRIILNKHTYTILAFTKNYIALRSDTLLKEINFNFIGTDEANKKYQPKYIQGKEGKTALSSGHFFISEEMYNYYISHPNLSDKELNIYLNDYFKRHSNLLVSEETQILIVQDIGYIEKIFCYWPNSFATKRFKETIDLK